MSIVSLTLLQTCIHHMPLSPFMSFFFRKDMVRLMMNKIFQSIETELNSLIALGDKIDSFNSLYMLVKMSHHVWTAENVDPASYLSTTLGNVLVTVKRNFDKCIVSSYNVSNYNILETAVLITNIPLVL